MDIEQTLSVAAPAEKVWAMLLDPKVMGNCVPGMQSIEVLSDTEYLALMQVKISFISAKFKLRTRIVEQRPPHYLRSEGTGEDTSVASSLKQQSEIFLSELPDGRTELRIKVKVDVVGRLGSFGLNVMKTKADRMWEEFAQNLAQRLDSETPAPPPQAPRAEPGVKPLLLVQNKPPGAAQMQPGRWWRRLLGLPPRSGFIHVELRRGDTLIRVDWPAENGNECAAWLERCMKQG